MYGVGKDTYNPGNTVIRAADWVDLCHWVDEVKKDSTHLSLQSTAPLTGEDTKAEYHIMLTYTGINEDSIKTCGDLGRIIQMLVSSDKVVLPCSINTNICALSTKRKAQTIAVIKRRTQGLYEVERLLLVMVIVMTITTTMIITDNTNNSSNNNNNHNNNNNINDNSNDDNNYNIDIDIGNDNDNDNGNDNDNDNVIDNLYGDDDAATADDDTELLPFQKLL